MWDNTLSDRFNHDTMYSILICLAITSVFKQYAGEPVNCWFPEKYKSMLLQNSWDAYCEGNVTKTSSNIDTLQLKVKAKYTFSEDLAQYNWTPVFFLIQAFMFLLPRMVWNYTKEMHGANLDTIVEKALKKDKKTQKRIDIKPGQVAQFIYDGIKGYWSRVERGFHLPVVTMYLVAKVLFTIHVAVQFYVVSYFLQLDFWNFGTSLVSGFLVDWQWPSGSQLPSTAMCHFEMPLMADEQTLEAHCVLTLNILLEKMFITLWFIFVFLLTANTMGLINWALTIGDLGNKSKQYMNTLNQYIGDTDEDKKLYRDFIKEYLHKDGTFVIQFIALNTPGMKASDLVRRLWLKYQLRLKK